MANNTSTKKAYNGIQPSKTMDVTLPTKQASRANYGGSNAGQMTGDGGPEAFGDPRQAVSAELKGLGGTYDDIGEKSGFITDGYLDKQDTPYGEAAKFNFLPPGMDISNQVNAEINAMPFRRIVAGSYPDDGWMPTPRDIPE